jgi:hypothetical protein
MRSKITMNAPVVAAAVGLLAFDAAAQSQTQAEPQTQRPAQTCYQDDSGRIVTRRRPGYREVPCPAPGEAVRRPPPGSRPSITGEPSGSEPQVAGPPPRQRPTNVSPIPRPGVADYPAAVPFPDRWRVVDALGYKDRWWDPYNRNVLKADRPVDDDWFFNVSVISDTVYELRNVPTPVGLTSSPPDSNDVFGGSNQNALIENLATEFVYYKGDTVFKPPDWEFRFTPVFNYNRAELDERQAVNADPRRGRKRTDYHLGIQAAFVDKHLRNVSERFDFDSFRVGIQPFSSDFRGFLFQDNQLGVRLFGTRDNNRKQYNLAYFRRLEKDTNSGLNDVDEPLRKDDVFIANYYWQDLPVLGFTSQVTLAYNHNHEDGVHFNANRFIERPASIGLERSREYHVGYLGYNGDGHFGRFNLTTSLYYAFGREQGSVFVDDDADISAGFAAAEASVDFDWIRPRVSLLYGSGDKNPFDDRSTGFDAIFENPQFAGADTSYWIRQSVPLIGGGRVALATRNGVLNSLRSSKEEGQSNFVNPGIALAGLGVDMDITPTFRATINANTLYFVETRSVEVARNQGPVDKHIGYDVSLSLTYRPLQSQNIVLRASYATLLPGDGFDALFPDEDAGYFMLNALLAY